MDNQSKLGSFIYDRGSSIYTIKEIYETEFTTRDRDGTEDILIKMKRVGLIDPKGPQANQVMNIILKKGIKLLQLKPIGRDHFDPNAKVCTLRSLQSNQNSLII